MRLLIALTVLPLLVSLASAMNPAAAADKCPDVDQAEGDRLVHGLNERHDDFFRYRRYLEGREKSMEKGRGENRTFLAEHERKLEMARKDYLKNRRPRPDTTAQESAAEREHKQRLARNEDARRCYVLQRARLDALMNRGRKVPEDLEYNLNE